MPGGVDPDGHCCEEEPEPREEVEREEKEMAEFGHEVKAGETAAAPADYMRRTTAEQRDNLDEAIAHGMDHNLDQHRADLAEFVKQQTTTSESGGMEKTEHGQQRADEARAGGTHRGVGDPNRVVSEGRQFRDTETGNTISVNGNRVVTRNSEGTQVTQFKNSRVNTQQRIRSGNWEPIQK